MKVVSKILLPSLLLLSLFWMAFQWSAPAQAAPTAPLAPGDVLYRVNAGGPALPAADGSTPGWSADTLVAPSAYVTFPVDQNRVYSTSQAILLDPAVPSAVPTSLFQTERWDPSNGNPNPLSREMRWAFSVPAGLLVEVRLYFAEIFPPINVAGERVFDVAVDGTVPPVFDNIDVFTLAGSMKGKGIVLSYVTTSDGLINLDFLHGVENPQVKGIEIVEALPVNPSAPTVANPLANIRVLQDAPPTVIDLANVFTDAEDGSNLTLSIATSTNPSLLTSTLNGSQLTLTYAPGQHGDAVVTIRATDSSNLAVDESFVVTVNGKPTVAPVADQTVAAESTLNLLLTAVDPRVMPLRSPSPACPTAPPSLTIKTALPT
ncbi:MAG: malectin domain-containing carbohydrate-binding protein [Caldilineaceae bacterium]